MKTKFKKLGLIFCIFLIIIAQAGCKNDSSKELKEVNKEIVALDTMCSIKVFTEDEDEGKKIVDAAIDKLQELDEEFSKTNKKSEVYKLNHAGGKRIEVSDKFAKVIKKSIELSKATGGRFDVTVGALTSLWDFTSGKNKVPSKAEIDKAKSTVGYKNIELKQNTCRLLNKDTQIDLGGIAKGYIGDAIKEYLQSKGIKNAIINLGGDVLTMGKKSSGEPYKVGIKKPFKGKQEILGYTEVQEGTVVTSGVYERTVSPSELRTSRSTCGRQTWPVAIPQYPAAICSGVTSTYPWPIAIFVMSPPCHWACSGASLKYSAFHSGVGTRPVASPAKSMPNFDPKPYSLM